MYIHTHMFKCILYICKIMINEKEALKRRVKCVIQRKVAGEDRRRKKGERCNSI